MVELATTSRLMKALGDETRLRLLNLLLTGELSVGELVEILNCAQSRCSAHLSLLREVGLVTDRKLGRRALYSLAAGPAADLARGIVAEAASTPEFQADLASLAAVKARQKEAARSYFDRVAASFGEQALPGRTWEGLSRGLLQLAPPVRYADLGIGDGLLTLMLAEVAKSVTAVDISCEMLDQLANRAKRAGLSNIETVQGELDDLPLEDSSFEVVVLSQALHHAEAPDRALREARRILVPGGRVIVLDLLAHNEEWVREKLQHTHLGFTEPGLAELLESSGFEDVRVQRAARDPHPPHFMTLLSTAHASARVSTPSL